MDRNIDYEEYVKQRNSATKVCKRTKADCEKKLVKMFKKNPKKLYGYEREREIYIYI